MRNRRPEADGGDAGSPAGVEQYADDPGRAFVARELQAELVDELRVGRRTGHGRWSRVRDVGKQRAQRHDELDTEITCEIGDQVAERAPAVIRLDTHEQDRVAARSRNGCPEERVLGPLDLPRLSLVERHHGSSRLEVDEELWIDVGELRAPHSLAR